MCYRYSYSEHTCLFNRVATAHLNSAECVHTCIRENIRTFPGHMCVHGGGGVHVCAPPQNPVWHARPPKPSKWPNTRKPGLQLQTGFSCTWPFWPFWPKPRIGVRPRTGAPPRDKKNVGDELCARAHNSPRKEKKKFFFFFIFFGVHTRARVCTLSKKKNFFFFENFRKNVNKTGFLPP